MNDALMTFWQAGAINLKQMLETGAFPICRQAIAITGCRRGRDARGAAQMEQGQMPQLDQDGNE